MKNYLFLAAVIAALLLVLRTNPQLAIVLLPFYFKAVEMIAIKNILEGERKK